MTQLPICRQRSFRLAVVLLAIMACGVSSAGCSRDSEEVTRLKLEVERLKLDLERAKLLANSAAPRVPVEPTSESFLESPLPGMSWEDFIERHRLLQGDGTGTSDALARRYVALAAANPDQPAYQYLAARATKSADIAEKCTRDFPKFPYCFRFMAFDGSAFDARLAAARRWAELEPDSLDARERLDELQEVEGCAVRIDVDPQPTPATSRTAFYFHVTAKNESKYLDVAYIKVEVGIEWMGNDYFGTCNALTPSAGNATGATMMVAVDEDHPTSRSARPEVKSFRLSRMLGADLTAVSRKTRQQYSLNSDDCKVTLFWGGREWTE